MCVCALGVCACVVCARVVCGVVCGVCVCCVCDAYNCLMLLCRLLLFVILMLIDLEDSEKVCCRKEKNKSTSGLFQPAVWFCNNSAMSDPRDRSKPFGYRTSGVFSMRLL